MSVRWDAGDWRGVLGFLLFLVIIFIPGLWAVHKTTGRPYRDMVLLLLGALVLIGLMFPAVVFFNGELNSPDPTTRKLTKYGFRYGLVAIGVLVWWGFNRLAQARRQQDESLLAADPNDLPEPPPSEGQ